MDDVPSPPPWICNPSEERFWVSVKEASVKLRVSHVTLYRWVENGFLTECYGIPVFRLGNRIFVRLKPNQVDRL